MEQMTKAGDVVFVPTGVAVWLGWLKDIPWSEVVGALTALYLALRILILIFKGITWAVARIRGTKPPQVDDE